MTVVKKRSGTPRNAARPYRFQKGWRVGFTDIDGKRKYKLFSSYEEATSFLTRKKFEVQSVKDGSSSRILDSITFSLFVSEHWIPTRLQEKRSQKDDLSILRKHLLPAFADLPLNVINTRRIEAFRKAIMDYRPSTQNNILGLLGAILHHAVELEMLTRMPIIRKPKIHRQDFDYLETEKEIQSMLETAQEESPLAHALFATAVFTGMRAGELFGLQWADVDFKKRLITVKRSFDKIPKSGHVRYVPILDVLAPILKKLKLLNQGPYVFPTIIGTMHQPSPRIIKETFPEVLKKAGLKRITFHSLRHTFASHWVMKGGDLFKLQKILGHASPQMTMRYAHLAPHAFENDLSIFNNKPQKKKKGEVISIDKAGM